MMLCLDAGNSRLKWGVLDSNAWMAQGVLAYSELEALPAVSKTLPTLIMACNVAGIDVAIRIETIAKKMGCPLVWLTSSASTGGVKNLYDHPEQLGADRWAGLIGARRYHAGAAVVVMSGTATTIDTIDGEGNFLGGLILPGLSMMRDALARNTADLPNVIGHFSPLPRNTADAIASGAIFATLGAVERQAALLPGAMCVLSGGAASELAPHLKLPTRVIDNLVLEGLALMASRHRSP